VRTTVPGQNVAGAYMELHADADARLLRASSPRVPRVELHEMRMDGTVMRMRPITAVALKGGEKVDLKPGGLHLMLVGLAQPIREGEKIPLTLVVERGGQQENVSVTAVARAGGHAAHHRHH
jgi:copper(I)-binding protein